MAKKKTEEVLERHLVAYTDGGCKPARGIGGWGVHGYIHTNRPQKKGSGLTTVVPTAKGYLPKKGKGNDVWAEDAQGNRVEAVEVLEYFDGIGNVQNEHGKVHQEATNNTAELMGLVRTLAFILEAGVTHAYLLLDSNYVREGLTQYVPKWIKNNWIKADGQPVKNLEYWKSLVELQSQIKAAGITLEMAYVAGHSDDLGNDTADSNATRGRIVGTKGTPYGVMARRDATGYWKPKRDVNPFITQSKAYFNTHAPQSQTEDGRFIYYLGNIGGKDDEFPGKEDPSHALSLLYLKEPEPVFETVRAFQDSQEKEGYQSFVIANLDALHSALVYPVILETGDTFLQRPYRQQDLYFADEPNPTNLTRDCRPPQLAFRLVDVFQSLGDKLNSYIKGDPTVMVTDITDMLYDGQDKTMKLKPEIDSQRRFLEVKLHYNTGKLEGLVDTKLTVGIDTPTRNALSALAALSPRVRAISWMESPMIIRYATVVETTDHIGLWCGPYSNARPLTELAPKR